MSIPNCLEVVEAIRSQYPETIESREDFCKYSKEVVIALNQLDERFGFLAKNAGQNSCDYDGQRVGVDVAMWRPTGETIDFIVSAGPGSKNTPSWNVNTEDAYPEDMWVNPKTGDHSEPEEPEEPTEPDNTDTEYLFRKLNEYLDQLGQRITQGNATLKDCQTRLITLQEHQSNMEVELYRRLNRTLSGKFGIQINLTPQEPE